MRCTSVLLAVLAISPSFAAAPLAQGTELDTLVASEAARAEGETAEALWTRALELRRAEELGDEGDLDRALDRLLARDDVRPAGKLLAAAARIQGEAPDPALLAPALIPLLSGDGELARAAAGLLGDQVFKQLQTAERTELGRALVAAARDGDRSPEARMAFASAAARVGRGTEMGQARDEMKAFLASGDPSTRALGALALGATGEEIQGELELELERLARLPDQRGSLAASYLKAEQIRSLYERKYKEAAASSNDRVQAVMDMILRYHLEGEQVDEEELTDAALNGMLRYMDEHSSYFGPAAYARFLQDLEAEYGGIGAYVGVDPTNRGGDGLFTITRPIYSGPAYRAGLASDDKVVRIDDWPTLGESAEDVIKRLKGKPKTDVKLYVWRRGMDPDLIDRPTEDMAVVLQREEIHIPAVAQQMLPGGIALIELTTFSRGCADEMREAFAAMGEEGLRAVVLDLRRNTGGLLPEAVNVANLFLEPGTRVVSTQGPMMTGGEEEVRTTTQEPAIPADVPVVVLTSRFTASASEIVAGALRDQKRATLVGETSFGKGSVQQLLPVVDMPEDEWDDQNRNGRWDTWEPIPVDHNKNGIVDYRPRIKMTIARYLLPNGQSIHRERDADGNILSEGGVEPDVVVPYPLIDSWRVRERGRVLDTRKIKAYVDARWDAEFDLFRRLAETDEKDAARYPDFDALVRELDTTLPPDDVRMLVRGELRRRVQDLRGAEFPIGDFQEDYQVQRAIDVLLRRFDESPKTYDAYARTFLEPDEVQLDHLAALTPSPASRDRLRDAQALIQEIRRSGGAITDDDLGKLLGALGYADEDR